MTSPFLSTKEACEFILNPREKVCTEIPRGCRKDATFVLDTSCFNHPDDFKADDNGSFRHHGSKSEFIKLDDDGEVSHIDDPRDPKPGEYKLTRTYWVHSSTKAFKRRTITLQDHVGELWPVIISYSTLTPVQRKM